MLALLALLLATDQPAPPVVTVPIPQETAPAPAAPPAEAPAAPAVTGVLLGGLDKITAKITKFTAPLGRTVSFGTLRVTAVDCRTQKPDEPPESAAFLTIDEPRPGQAHPVQWFNAWMFASSPAVSALQHPVYDIWVLTCITAETGSAANPG